MAIKSTCGKCGRVYVVEDEFDGRDIHCKDCHALIHVPAESENDWNDAEESLPHVHMSKSTKTKHRSHGRHMPVSIMIALTCIAVMICISILEFFGIGRHRAEAGVAQEDKVVMTIGVVFRFIIQIFVFWGVFKGTPSTVMPSIGMAVISILIFAGAAVLDEQLPGGGVMVLALLFFMLLRVIYIGCMLTPSAKKYMQT